MAEDEKSEVRPQGTPYKIKPFEINGVFYDSDQPPTLFTTREGKEEYRGGKVLDRDEAFSQMFWARKQAPGKKEAMDKIIESAAGNGVFSYFVVTTKNDNEILLDQKSKEVLSAFRIIAREQGYVIGPFKYNKNADTVKAPISKPQSQST